MTTRKNLPSKKNPALSQRNSATDVLTIANPLVFISHDSRDAELAEAFSKLLSSISAGMLKSFRSSDKKGTEGIEFGVDWYPEVMSKIDSASDVVCLLTPRSLERPWILYEAGVAKGKMNTPVYGVALGVSLSSAATGPFAQFQNCGEDADSLNKLVLQLMCRVNGAEPDKDTVKMQVDAFKKKADALTQGLEKATNVSKTKHQEIEGSSVAKLFEEVKVMFRDLPLRMDSKPTRSARVRFRHIHPEMLFDIEHQMGLGRSNGFGLLVLVSIFKDDAPWLYELGVQTYRVLSSGSVQMGRVAALRRFASACELAAHHPMFRDLHENRDFIMALMETAGYANSLRQYFEDHRHSGEEHIARKADPLIPKKKPEV